MQYLIGLSIIHSLLLSGYWLFLKNESQYHRMRIYMTGSTVLALLIPLLRLPSLWQYFFNNPTDDSSELIGYMLSPATIVYRIPAEETADFALLVWTYLMVTGWFLFHFAKNVLFLIRLERSSSREIIDGIYVRRTPHFSGTFTFFNWIFVNQQFAGNVPESLPILRHEQAHVTLGHSFDLVFFELFRSFFWWLPSAWYLRREIKKIHEYQADAYALKVFSIDQYSSLLIHSALKASGLHLVSSFHDDLTMKRLKAMKQQVSGIKTWKLSVLGMLGVFLFITFACNEELDAEIKKIGENNNLITFDQLPQQMRETLADKKESLLFTKIMVDDVRELNTSENLQSLDPNLIYAIDVQNATREVFIALKKEGVHFDSLSEKSRMEDEVFTLVENQPRYPEGMAAFYQLLGEQLSYPHGARLKGIQGRVYVQFIVDTDGSLTEIKVIKGIGAGCDEEAIRVLQLTSGKWTPGTQRGQAVKVRMVLPVEFKLNPEIREVSLP